MYEIQGIAEDLLTPPERQAHPPPGPSHSAPHPLPSGNKRQHHQSLPKSCQVGKRWGKVGKSPREGAPVGNSNDRSSLPLPEELGKSQQKILRGTWGFEMQQRDGNNRALGVIY